MANGHHGSQWLKDFVGEFDVSDEQWLLYLCGGLLILGTTAVAAWLGWLLT